MLHTTQEYEAIRAEFRKLSKKNFTKFGTVVGKLNMYVVAPFALVLPIVGLFADILRFLWALPLGILAFFILSLLANASKSQKLADELGDDVLIKKVLREDVVIVDPVDVRMLVLATNALPESAAIAEAIGRLEAATERYDERARRATTGSRRTRR
jgi:hypothetical protein